jgi:hypothetical protein
MGLKSDSRQTSDNFMPISVEAVVLRISAGGHGISAEGNGRRMTMNKMELTGVENVIGTGRLVVWLLGHKMAGVL